MLIGWFILAIRRGEAWWKVKGSSQLRLAEGKRVEPDSFWCLLHLESSMGIQEVIRSQGEFLFFSCMWRCWWDGQASSLITATELIMEEKVTRWGGVQRLTRQEPKIMLEFFLGKFRRGVRWTRGNLWGDRKGKVQSINRKQNFLLRVSGDNLVIYHTRDKNQLVSAWRSLSFFEVDGDED